MEDSCTPLLSGLKAVFMSSSVKWLRIIGFIEGVSLLVLMGIAMPLKYMAGKPGPVKYVGCAHGLLFIAFIAIVLLVTVQKKWSFKTVIYGFLAAFLPFGTFVFDRWLLRKKEALNG